MPTSLAYAPPPPLFFCACNEQGLNGPFSMHCALARPSSSVHSPGCHVRVARWSARFIHVLCRSLEEWCSSYWRETVARCFHNRALGSHRSRLAGNEPYVNLKVSQSRLEIHSWDLAGKHAVHSVSMVIGPASRVLKLQLLWWGVFPRPLRSCCHVPTAV